MWVILLITPDRVTLKNDFKLYGHFKSAREAVDWAKKEQLPYSTYTVIPLKMKKV
jgi:hypothetical protein